jgi:hypothetical protein
MLAHLGRIIERQTVTQAELVVPTSSVATALERGKERKPERLWKASLHRLAWPACLVVRLFVGKQQELQEALRAVRFLELQWASCSGQATEL